ncbi:hypothetical protein [Marinoscillum sp. MHG1-6]|uniref:hypothetical protein n=1 Tax=Marinoscillum sp. MHG1-6 TaxID=2959627 RepID=UPI0021575C53|nr:hypothetical protein [Marinoscillum sp. MHG1-6]
MNVKAYRYLLYFGIGVMMYFVLKEEGGTGIQEIHRVAPWIILSIVVLMMVLRFIVEKKRNKDE